MHHHLNNQNQRGRCQCWINFTHAFMISLKILLTSKLMVIMDITQWFDDYIHLFGGIDKYKELKRSLLVDGLSMI